MRLLLVALGVSSLIAGCGGGGSSSPRAHATRARSAPCVSARGFGGLGASINVFDANNNNTIGESGPTPGAAFYAILGSEHGCLTAYLVQDSAGPPLKAPQMLALVSDGYLPRDAKQLVDTGSCAVWRSAALQRAVGLGYAQATAAPQTATAPGRAQIHATSESVCYLGSGS